MKNKKEKWFEDFISEDFKEKIYDHLADMDKHDLITHKIYVNRGDLKTKRKIKPNAFLGKWTAGMDVYADDGHFPQKGEIVVESSNCGENGYVVPYDYAIFQIGNELSDSYRGMVLSLNDIAKQIDEIKKYASKNISTKAGINKRLKDLQIKKLHQIVMVPAGCPNPSMTMQPIAEREK